MQMCLSTSTMPSARLNEAPVGHTSTHGGCSQCWHIIGSVCAYPVRLSRRFTLRIHCGSVVRAPVAGPAVLLAAGRDATSQSAHFVMSISRPQRCSAEAGLLRRARLRELDQAQAGREQRARRGGRAPAQESAPAGRFAHGRAATPRYRRIGLWHSKQSMLTEAYAWQLAQKPSLPSTLPVSRAAGSRRSA